MEHFTLEEVSKILHDTEREINAGRHSKLRSLTMYESPEKMLSPNRELYSKRKASAVDATCGKFFTRK